MLCAEGENSFGVLNREEGVVEWRSLELRVELMEVGMVARRKQGIRQVGEARWRARAGVRSCVMKLIIGQNMIEDHIFQGIFLHRAHEILIGIQFFHHLANISLPVIDIACYPPLQPASGCLYR